MTDNIDVKPSDSPSRVSVATDDIDGTHYPIYKLAHGAEGEITLVQVGYGMPLATDQSEGNVTNTRVFDEGANELLGEMLIVLKKIEYHLSVATGDEFVNGEFE